MQIKKNRAVQFRTANGTIRCGVIRDFLVTDDGFIAEVTIRGGEQFIISNADVVYGSHPRIVV